MKMKKLLVCLAVTTLAVGAIFLSATSRSSAGRDETLRVGVLPTAEEGELHERFAPLLARLSQSTGRGTRLVTVASYEELLQLFKERRVDLAFFGGLTFIRANTFFGAEPLVMRDTDKRASSYAVVKDGGPFQDCYNLACANLRQARLVFGPPLSTSGHLMPRHFFEVRRGITPETYFSAVSYADGHRAAAGAVCDGEADLAMVNARMFRSMLHDGEVSCPLRVVWETAPFSDAVWTVPKEMDEALKTRIRDTFLALEPTGRPDPAGPSLDLFDTYLPAGVSDFASLTDIAAAQGLMRRTSP